MPTISTISPSTFDSGKSVTLTGSGFGSSQGQVLIGGVAQNVNTWSDDEITFTTVRGSQSLGACRVDVVTASGTASWQLASGHWTPAKMPMRIIHPATSTTSTYIYENWYTGMALDLPVCVQGGAWPFYYELTTAPSGMTIGQQYGNANYGRITWSSPTAGTHSVAVKVTDQDGNIVTKTWTLTVGTSKHVFFDAVNGNDANSGTLAAPYKTFAPWANVSGNALNGKIAVYRAGTYSTSSLHAIYDSGNKAYYISSQKPLVHMAYPGESVTFNTTSAGLWNTATTSHEMAFIGISWTGLSPTVVFYVRYEGSSRHLFDSNTFGQSSAYSAGISNPACIMPRDVAGYAEDLAITNNTFSGLQGYGFAEIYDCQYGLFEGNTVINNDSTGGRPDLGLYLKLGVVNHWSIRNNKGLTGNAGVLVKVDSYGGAINQVEVCWNNYISSALCMAWKGQNVAVVDQWAYRNTFQRTTSGAAINIENMSTTPIVLENNVIEHTGSYTDGISIFNSSGSLTKTSLLSAANTNYADTTGALNGAYLAYRGTHGWEVA